MKLMTKIRTVTKELRYQKINLARNKNKKRENQKKRRRKARKNKVKKKRKYNNHQENPTEMMEKQQITTLIEYWMSMISNCMVQLVEEESI